jgi:hypothetical protein
MNNRIYLVTVAVLTASVISLFMHTAAQAIALTDEQKAKIQSNCLSIQGALNQLHSSDALLRVNRGQIYETVGTKLMNNFNARLNNNGLDNKGLVAVTDQYQAALTSFRANYRVYERQLSAAMDTDCTSKPVAFHDAVAVAREKRAAVYSDVLRMNRFIDDYRSAVNDFMLNFDRVTAKQ